VAAAVAALTATARGHDDARCREASVAALGAIGEVGGLPAVIDALGDKPTVRRRAAVALAGFDDPRTEPALRRAATLADGLFPLKPLEGGWKVTFEKLRQWRQEAGLSWESFGIEARVGVGPNWAEEVEQWRQLGATHVYLSNLGTSLAGREHITAVAALGGQLKSFL